MKEKDQQDLLFKCGKVFSPATPINTRDLFAGRTDQITQVGTAVHTRGQHAIIFGERGVGKTSLANILKELLGGENTIAVKVNCHNEDTFAMIWRNALSEIEVSWEEETFGFRPQKHAKDGTAADSIVAKVGPEDLRRILHPLSKEADVVVIFDEFDRLRGSKIQRLFADTIKNFSDHALNTTMVIVGVANDVSGLIKEHASVDRSLVQIRMPRMEPDELKEIIKKAMRELGLSIHPEALELLVLLSQGLPHYTHLLGYESTITTIQPGQLLNFPVTLTSPAPDGGVFISLVSSDTSKLTISPANVLISQGGTVSNQPKITGVGVGSATITASVFGFPSASQTLQVTTPPTSPSYVPVASLGSVCTVEQLNPLLFSTRGAALRINFSSAIAHASSSWTFSIDYLGKDPVPQPGDLGIKTGPWISFASFQGADWNGPKRIINEAGLADILVVYHQGHEADDLQFISPVNLRQIFPSDLPAVGGGLVTLERDFRAGALGYPRIGVECHERGIDWLCKSNYKNPTDLANTKNLTGRGYEVVVWAVIDGGNYDNILQYIFRDDGSVGFRLGTSGSIDRNRPTEAHMHNGLWRLSTSLFGSDSNRVYEMKHQDIGGTAVDTEIPITQEGFRDFSAPDFTSLLIENTVLTNARGNLMGYEVVPSGLLGSARHSEPFTKHDFWVTVDHPEENGTGASAPNDWRNNFRSPDQTMLGYANGEAMNVDMTPVIWYRSSVHHHPTDSDRDVDGNVGITSVHWAGFDFHPHNAFNFNPMTGGLPYCE